MVSPIPSAFALFWIVIKVHLSIAASCTQSDWEWSHNSLGQDPCTVVQILEARCKNLTSYDLEPLTPGTDYMTPQQGEAPGCSCNTVTYSLYQACSQCQILGSGNTWTFYEKYCTQVYVTQIPLSIPGGTKVPPWAYLDVTKEDNFNPIAARAAVGSSTSPSSPPPVATSSRPAVPTPSNSNHMGVIIGSVVGGSAAVILVIAFGLFWLLRNRKKPTSQRKVRSEKGLSQVEESLLSPGPLSPPTITRDLPENATYRELSWSGVMTAYDSSFYPKNTAAPSRNGYHGFAEV